ncbi:MAG: hypothetical protein C0501_01060 [Isosphaera sp.]|nr:hypothetical protein [Isosphaera sp.]
MAAAPSRSYLRRHGAPMLLAAVVSSAATAAVIVGVQHYRPGSADARERDHLRQALLGKWELIEPLSPGVEPGDRWFEARPDGTMQFATVSVVRVDGRLASKAVRLETHAYEVKDGSHFLLNPGGAEHLMRVVLDGDRLTLFKMYGAVERYRQAAGPDK